MNLSSAIAKFKSVKNTVDVNSFSTKVNRVLSDSISEVEDNLKRLKEDQKEAVEEQERDMVYALLSIDTDRLAKKADREQYAQEYVVEAARVIFNFDKAKAELEEEIKTTSQQVKNLKNLKQRLENIDLEKFVEKDGE
jgi:hypothetical protein